MRSTSSFNRLGDFQVDIENLFDHFFKDPSNPTEAKTNLVPRSDVVESEKGYSLIMELPGITSEDVSIEMKENVLEVRGTKRVAELGDGQRMAKSERRGGEFIRKFEFASRVDADSITANFKDGLLAISLPKCEKAMPRKIKIDTA